MRFSSRNSVVSAVKAPRCGASACAVGTDAAALEREKRERGEAAEGLRQHARARAVGAEFAGQAELRVCSGRPKGSASARAPSAPMLLRSRNSQSTQRRECGNREVADVGLSSKIFQGMEVLQVGSQARPSLKAPRPIGGA